MEKKGEFLHAAARVACLENNLVTESELLKAATLKTSEEVYHMLAHKHVFSNMQLPYYERGLEKNLAQTYELIEDITEGSEVTYIFRYPIDGHNLKVIIKENQSRSDGGDLYKKGGTVDAASMKDEIKNGKYLLMPKTLADAGVEAAELLAKTEDSHAAEGVIDIAVAELMKEKADMIGSDLAVRFTAAIFDTLDFGQRRKSFEERKSKQGVFVKMFDIADISPFGIDPVIRFLYMKDREIRACRFVMAAKLFDADGAIAEKGIRYMYGR